MEQIEHSALSGLTADQAAAVNLIRRASNEGLIQEHRLQHYLDRLELEPEVVSRLCEQLKAERIQLLSGVDVPEYDPDQRLTIPELLELRGHELSERAHQIMTMRFIQRKSLQEAAEQLGITRERVRQVEVMTVRKLTHRSLTRMKKIRDFYT